MSIIEVLENFDTYTDCHNVEHIGKTWIINTFIESLTHFYAVVSKILHEIIMKVFQKSIDFSFKSSNGVFTFSPSSSEILKDKLFLFRDQFDYNNMFLLY